MSWGMRNIVISIFGSSIMEGRIGVEKAEDRYYNILQRKLSEEFPEVCFAVVNGATGGWSTRELMEGFEENVLRFAPDYCLVMFGANNHDQNNPERILKDGELQELMNEFERKLPVACRRIGVICSPVINSFHFVTHDPAWQPLLQQYGGLDEVMEIEREEARKHFSRQGCPVLDLGKEMRRDMNKYILACDGIHLSPEGHKFFAEALFEIMKQVIVENNQDTNGRE